MVAYNYQQAAQQHLAYLRQSEQQTPSQVLHQVALEAYLAQRQQQDQSQQQSQNQ